MLLLLGQNKAHAQGAQRARARATAGGKEADSEYRSWEICKASAVQRRAAVMLALAMYHHQLQCLLTNNGSLLICAMKNARREEAGRQAAEAGQAHSLKPPLLPGTGTGTGTGRSSYSHGVSCVKHMQMFA